MVLVAASQLDDNIAVLEWLQTASYLIEFLLTIIGLRVFL